MLREDCCAGMVPHGCASLRCRRQKWLYSGDEGSREPGARCAGRERRVRDQQRHGRDARRGAICPRRDRTSAPKARRSWTRGCRRRVKRAPCKAETRGVACKGVSAVRRHARGLYDAGTYYYTLVKCLKSFVRNGKGVIEANDYTQGSPINSEPLVMKRTHCNEKRVPKATAVLSVFGLLSVPLFPFRVIKFLYLPS
jgi:hypothetical protein